mgnify:CR=1 FL=1|tara:strand:+ start:113 stop:1627 length:1515 start_codon:yes stop_codon:yes gene_type:complete
MNDLLFKDLYVRRNDDSVAIIYNNALYSYKAIYGNSLKLANKLDDIVGKQGVVLTILPNCIEFVYSFYSCMFANIIFMPIDYHSSVENIKFYLKDTSCKCVFTTTLIYKKIQNEQFIKGVQFIIVDANKLQSNSLDSILETDFNGVFFPETSIAVSDNACLFYTTGTSGFKKGVLLSHKNLMTSTKNICKFMGIESPIVESLPMPLSHSFGFARLRVVFSVGGTVVLENGLIRPELIFYNIKKYEVNALSMVPAGFRLFLSRYEDQFLTVANQLLFIELGSAPMSVDEKKQLLQFCENATICMHYGLTEASRSVFLNFNNSNEHLGSIGKASPNALVKLVDQNNCEIEEDGIAGQFVVSGAHVAKSYWKNEMKSLETFKDNFVYTNDMGIRKDGFYYFLGRSDDVININGLKVAPEEIEQALRKCIDIEDAAVIGVFSDKVNMDIIKAFLVTSNKHISETALIKECSNFLESFKIPSEFTYVSIIPKTASGKIQRNLLKEGTNL